MGLCVQNAMSVKGGHGTQARALVAFQTHMPARAHVPPFLVFYCSCPSSVSSFRFPQVVYLLQRTQQARRRARGARRRSNVPARRVRRIGARAAA